MLRTSAWRRDDDRGEKHEVAERENDVAIVAARCAPEEQPGERRASRGRPSWPPELQQMLRDLYAENDKLRLLIDRLTRQQFGRRSEQLAVEQLQLGLEDQEQTVAEHRPFEQCRQFKKCHGPTPFQDDLLTSNVQCTRLPAPPLELSVVMVSFVLA